MMSSMYLFKFLFILVSPLGTSAKAVENGNINLNLMPEESSDMASFIEIQYMAEVVDLGRRRDSIGLGRRSRRSDPIVREMTRRIFVTLKCVNACDKKKK